MPAVGMITIGQTPRDDLTPHFQDVLGPAFTLLEAGALDGLSPAQIAELAPATAEFPLITRLADGSEVVVAKERLVPLLQECLDGFEGRADLSVVLCTGTFPRLRATHPLLEPDRILFAAAGALHPGGTLGVLLPIPGQLEGAAARWSGVSKQLACEVDSPYRGDEGLREAGARFRAAGATLVVVDCMGFTQPKKEILRQAAGAPVLLASSILARFIAEVA